MTICLFHLAFWEQKRYLYYKRYDLIVISQWMMKWIYEVTFRDVIAKKPPTIKTPEIQSLDFLWFAVCWRVILSLFDIDKRKILKLANTTFDKIFTFSKERQQPMKELKIDPELRDLLPPLADDEYKQLEKNIVDNGFDRNFPIMEWRGFIVDGHNRYSICRKHNIDYTIGTLDRKSVV